MPHHSPLFSLPGFASARDILCNCIIKSFPDGFAEVLVANRAVFRRPGFEPLSPNSFNSRVLNSKDLSDSHLWRWEDQENLTFHNNLSRAKRRAKANVHDLALANNFRFFVTLTLDPAKVDRYDISAVTRKLNVWLDNQVRRHGLVYLLVAERHKDAAIHFHGFFNDALSAVDSGTLSLGGGKPRKPRSARQRADWLRNGAHVVYNLPAWSLGFTTAIEIYGDKNKAVGYICKYISKANEKIGGRWYYSGGNLVRPQVSFCNADFDYLSSLVGFGFHVDAVDADMYRLML